jgi:MFS family permease
MITLSYVGSAVVAVVLAVLFATQTGGVWTFIVVLAAAFFLASAGASAAYLTVSEIFPMETRALAIAFFYAVGTAIGGITGPLLFGQMINSGQRGQVVWSFLIGAAVMAVAGLVELWLGVAAEQRPLEELALPLTVADAERDEESKGDSDGQPTSAQGDHRQSGHGEGPAAGAV